MGRFDVQTETVELEHDGETYEYEIQPLEGKHIDLIYDVTSALSHIDEGQEEQIQAELDGEMASKLHTVVFETLKKSYPDTKEEKLDQFASQHQMELIEPILLLNQNQA